MNHLAQGIGYAIIGFFIVALIVATIGVMAEVILRVESEWIGRKNAKYLAERTRTTGGSQ